MGRFAMAFRRGRHRAASDLPERCRGWGGGPGRMDAPYAGPAGHGCGEDAPCLHWVMARGHVGHGSPYVGGRWNVGRNRLYGSNGLGMGVYLNGRSWTVG